MNRHVVMICDKCRTIDKTVDALVFWSSRVAFRFHRLSSFLLVFSILWRCGYCTVATMIYNDLFGVVGMHCISNTHI